jgi:hypothetical protein
LTTLPRLDYLGNIVRPVPGRKGGGSSMRRVLQMTELVTQARLKELLVYDRKTGHFYWRETRGGSGRGTQAGTVNADGYIRICIDRRPYYAHRLGACPSNSGFCWPEKRESDSLLPHEQDIPRLEDR